MLHPSTAALFDQLDAQIDGAKSALSILRAAAHEPKHRADLIDEAPLRPFPAPRHLKVGPSPDSSVAAFDHRTEVAAENARRDGFFKPLADHADDAIELTGGER